MDDSGYSLFYKSEPSDLVTHKKRKVTHFLLQKDLYKNKTQKQTKITKIKINK